MDSKMNTGWSQAILRRQKVCQVSRLLVLIVEKISMIGILKSFGAQNNMVRNIFIRLGTDILIKGILLGNAIAFVIIGLQSEFGFIKLPQDKYYLSKVPLGFEWNEFIIINAITVIIGLSILYFTSIFVARITPVKAIKFE